MIYILDTNIIRKLLFHFPKKGKLFEKVWASLEAGIEADVYISVDECFNELSGQFSKDNDAFKWINERKTGAHQEGQYAGENPGRSDCRQTGN